MVFDLERKREDMEEKNNAETHFEIMDTATGGLKGCPDPELELKWILWLSPVQLHM